MESLHDLEVLVESKKTGLVVIETEREGCFIEGFKRIADRSNVAYFHWTVTKGLLRLKDGFKHQSHNRDMSNEASLARCVLHCKQILSFHHVGSDLKKTLACQVRVVDSPLM